MTPKAKVQSFEDYPAFISIYRVVLKDKNPDANIVQVFRNFENCFAIRNSKSKGSIENEVNDGSVAQGTALPSFRLHCCHLRKGSLNNHSVNDGSIV